MLNEKELTIEKINASIDEHIKEITTEFRAGFEFLEKYPKSVTIFGSSRLTDASPHYDEAKKLGSRIVTDLKYAVITGGGPGIMEAANWGAHDAGGQSVGLNINIPNEQHINKYANSNSTFNFFFARKAMLSFSAEAYVFFPGGFGTFDELFCILTLLQTQKIPAVPVILFGSDFWNPFMEFITDTLLDTHHTIAENDLKIFTVTDSIDEALGIIKKAPYSPWWKMLD